MGWRRGEFYKGHENGVWRVVCKSGKVEGRDKNIRSIMLGAGKATIGPMDCLFIMGGEYNLICSPVDHRINVSQPRFVQNKIIFAQRIDNCVQVVKVIVAV
jgi:hypothetical protein